MNKLTTGFQQDIHRPKKWTVGTNHVLNILLAVCCSVCLVVSPVAAAAWCWDPVALTCGLQPAQVTAYVVLVAWITPTFYPCQVLSCKRTCAPLCDCAQDPACCELVWSECVFYTRSAWSDADRVLAPATCTGWDSGTPTRGEVILVSVIAENGAGRGPMGPCP
jgi:hypothetical protein